MRPCFHLCLLCLLLLLPAPLWALADVSGFTLEGVRLGMTPAQVETITGIAAKPKTGPGGVVYNHRALRRVPDVSGGFFQTTFAREELGGRAYNVTLNTRSPDTSRSLEDLLAEFVERYGKYDTLCVNKYEDHTAYHLWWGAAFTHCDNAGKNIQGKHMYLNLIKGVWTEIFQSLKDPKLLKRNVEAVRQARAAGKK
jgi:hypothetical protein